MLRIETVHHVSLPITNLSASYRGALEHLHTRGYSADATDPLRKLRENPTGTAGFPQIYLLDPDRVIEINAGVLD